MRKLFMTYAEVRRMYGKESYHRPSRFLHEIPGEFIDEIRFRTKVSASTSRQSRSTSFKPQAKGAFQIGQEVTHRVFGDGTVLNCEGDGEHMKVTVRFPQVGTKLLVAQYLNAKG